MAVNPFEVEEFLDEARARVTEQFKSKDIFDRYLQILLYDSAELQEVFRQLMQERSIDTAVGAQLDIIGEIVGQPRDLIDTSLFQYFAFDGYLNAESFGDLNNNSVGGIYYSLGDPLSGNTLLNDEQYRLFIKAKIIKNTSNVTPNQLLDFLKFVFNSPYNSITELGNAKMILLVGKPLSNFEKILLTYQSTSSGYSSRFIPKQIGVGIEFGQFDYENYFGFQGSPNAKGYGDLQIISAYGYNYGADYGQSIGSLVGGGKFAELL
jgi:hypothetical protein